MFCLCLPSRMRTDSCSVHCGGLILLLCCCLLGVHSQVPSDQQQHLVVESAAQLSGHGHGRLDKDMVQDKE